MRIIAIDWSGAKIGAANRIWRADVVDGNLAYLANGFTQDELTAQLIDLAARDEPIVAGLDFAFSMPAWFLEQQRIPSAPELWRRVAADALGEEWLARCEPPFWGRPGSRRPQQADLFRRTERDTKHRTGFLPKSVFQIGGAGAVGTASLRGMRALHHLRRAGFRVWPFDDPGLCTMVEIYPRIFTGPVRKSDPEARAAHIASLQIDRPGRGVAANDPPTGDQPAPPDAIPATHIPAPHREAMIRSEDAFDAAISALHMWPHRHQLARLQPARDNIEQLEGAIFLPTP